MIIKTSLVDTFNCELSEHAEKQLDTVFKTGAILVIKQDNGRYMVVYGILRHKIAVEAGKESLDCIILDAKTSVRDGLLIVESVL